MYHVSLPACLYVSLSLHFFLFPTLSFLTSANSFRVLAFLYFRISSASLFFLTILIFHLSVFLTTNVYFLHPSSPLSLSNCLSLYMSLSLLKCQVLSLCLSPPLSPFPLSVSPLSFTLPCIPRHSHSVFSFSRFLCFEV